MMVWDVYYKIEELSGKNRGEHRPVDINVLAHEIGIQKDIVLEYVRGFQILDRLTYDDTTSIIKLR